MTVRPTLATDLPLLPTIERSAAQAFRQYPTLAWLADSEVMDEAAHAAFAGAGTSWVARCRTATTWIPRSRRWAWIPG